MRACSWQKIDVEQEVAIRVLPGQSLTSDHAGMRSKSSSGSACDAHWTKFPYSSFQNDLEQLIAQRP